MAKVEYKFKPYSPKNLKMAKPKDELANLEKQRDNLEARLRAEGVDPETLGGEFDNRNFLQKAFNTSPESPGFLMDFFEVINRPTEAVKAAIDAGLNQENVLEAAMEGLRGNIVTPGGDILESFGVDFGDSPVAEFVEDIGADILLDPLNLIPAGYLLKKFKGVFMRSKTKLFKQFTGNFIDVFKQVRKLDGTLFDFQNIDELEAFLKNASTEEIASINKQLKELAKKKIPVFDPKTNKPKFDKATQKLIDDGTLTVEEAVKQGKQIVSNQFNGTVYEVGEKGREILKWEDHGNNYHDLKARADKLNDIQKRIDEIDAQVASGDLSIEEGLEKMQEVVPKSFKQQTLNEIGGKSTPAQTKIRKIKNQVLTELELYNDAMAVVKKYGDEYDVLLNKTGNRVDDVTIVRRVKVGEETYYIKALGLEAKEIGGFALGSASFNFFEGALDFTAGSKAFFNYKEKGLDVSARLKSILGRVSAVGDGQQTVLNRLKDLYDTYKGAKRTPKIVNGKVVKKNKKIVYEYFKNGKKLASPEESLSLFMKKELGKEGFEEYKELMLEMFMVKNDITDNSVIYFGGPNSQKRFMIKFKDIKGALNFDQTRFGWFPSGQQLQFRMGAAGGVKLDLDFFKKPGSPLSGLEQLIADGVDLAVDDVIQLNQVEVARTAQINVFEANMEREGLIGSFNRVMVKFINFMKNNFSAYGFLTPELAQQARRLKGETAVQYQTRMLRLTGIRDAFQKQFPGVSDSFISQLVESGARLDENGAIIFGDRKISLKDYLRSFIESTNNGNPGLLRKFAKGKDKEFVDKLNEVANVFYGSANSPQKLFFIEELNGVKVLRSKMDGAELQRMLKALDVDDVLGIGRYKDDFLDYGKYNQVPDSLLKLPDEAVKILQEWKEYEEFVNLHGDVQMLLVKEGGYTNILNEAGQLNDTYLRHIMTKQAYEYLSKNRPGVLSKFAKPGSEFFKARKYLGSIEEVNEYLKAIYNLDMDVFDPSAFRAAEDFFKYAFRNIEQSKLMELLLAGKDKFGEGLLKVVDNIASVTDPLKGENIIFTSFKEEFPQLMKNLSQTQQDALIQYLTKAGLKDNQAIVMNRTIHRVMKESERAFKSLDDLTVFYDKFLNTWKGLTLVTPGFHLRNLFGNMFNSYVAGMDTFAQLKYTRIGMLEIDGYERALKLLAQGTKIDDLPPTLRNYYEKYVEFRRSGLIQSHRGVRDLESLKEASELAAKGDLKGAKKLYNDVIRLNFNFAEKMDDTQRYILYRWALDKTGDANKAAKIVTDSLFDYSALTTFEKDVMKRLFPFYTFMKNNFIFHAKNILANPKMYARTGRAYKYYLEDIAGYTIEDLPDYAAESMWLPIPMMITKNDEEGIAFLKANLPVTDFMELVQNPFEKGVQSVTVPIKLAIEVGAGRDMFTGQPITKFPGQTNVMEEGTGVLSNLRNRRGQLTIFQTPLAQKIANDIGLRTPLNFGTAALDIVDTLTEYQGPQSGLADIMERAGVASVSEIKRMKITQLYQDLEQLRNLKRLYEQETGNQLPVLPRG
jgi:hypothetical protein